MFSQRQFLGIVIVCGLLSLAGCKGADFGRPSFSAQGDDFRLLVNDRGAISVEVDGEFYTIESFYSYPGPGGKIGTNELSCRKQTGAWQLDIQKEKTVPEQIRIIGKGKYYTLIRTVSAEESRIVVSDEIVNETNEDVGVIIRHRVVTAEAPKEILFGGAPWKTGKGIVSACKDIAKLILVRLGWLTSGIGYQSENPTLFVSLKRSHLGIIAEDTLSRLQFEGHRYGAAFSMEHFALSSNVTRTLKWAIYPLGRGTNYFTFINRVRRDWKTNFTIPGPYDFICLIKHHEILEQSPAQVSDYLKRKRLRPQIVAFTPWLDYDNFNWRTGKNVDRKEYKKLLRSGMKALKSAIPGIKCLGCIQSCWRLVPPDIMNKLYEKISQEHRKQGFYRFTDEQMKVAQDLPLDWKDSFVTAPDGRYIYELYYTGPQNEPMIAIGVYAAAGNSQLSYWMDQAKFIMEDVGLDGIYIDGFSLAFRGDPSQRYTYNRWDGVTVDIDANTGEILRRYTDCAWLVVQAQKSLIQYVHSRGGVIVANTAASAQEVQSSPVMRFMEASGVMGTFNFVEGREPPLVRHLCRGQLGSPIALGWTAHPCGDLEDRPEYSRKVMEAAITYLRHGLLYYYFFYGHYGDAINHMFPITPTSIGKGFVVGKERIVTSVSGKFLWNMDRKPRVLCFDMENHPNKANFSLQKVAGGWQVKLELNDWKEICIVE